MLAYEELTAGPTITHEQVKLSHPGKPPLRSLIVVMDESVRGDLLDLNLASGAPTGLVGREDVVDLGVVPSIANCSDTTNVAFRYGIGRKDYLKQLARNPSLWSYARRAGYHTYYVEAQRVDGALQNGMDADELRDSMGMSSSRPTFRPPSATSSWLARCAASSMTPPCSRASST